MKLQIQLADPFVKFILFSGQGIEEGVAVAEKDSVEKKNYENSWKTG